ncbi:phage terminase small subunit-related protein [Clostridium botulinum]|uniref:phage terminase small subunit-related protein n=1 Tax=Clostridium botulinum TaxID=1491 RepID=UPI00077308B0|nr:phage terminase small subunit-related protein [Clostridium botulinum]
MGKTRSPNRERALEIYIENGGNITPKKIAEILGESASNISSWKNKDRWNEKLPTNRGGAPKGNLNSLKHGLYCDDNKRLPKEFLKKWFPSATIKAYEDSYSLGISKIDKIGHYIDTIWAKVMRSQKITEVKNKRDTTKELKRTKESYGDKSSSEEKEYEIQFSWDKVLKNLEIESKVLEKLTNAIKTYEELLHKDWDLATKEQKLRIDKLKAEVAEITGENEDEEIEDDGFIEALNGTAKEDWSDEED